MRKLAEILEGIRENTQRPDENEAYLTIVTQDILITSLVRKVQNLLVAMSAIDPTLSTLLTREVTATLHGAYSQDPDTYLGEYRPGGELYDSDNRALKEQAQKILETLKELKKVQEDTEIEEATLVAEQLKNEDKLN